MCPSLLIGHQRQGRAGVDADPCDFVAGARPDGLAAVAIDVCRPVAPNRSRQTAGPTHCRQKCLRPALFGLRAGPAHPGCAPPNDSVTAMPYYLVPVADIPYPHAMGERGKDAGCPLALSNL